MNSDRVRSLQVTPDYKPPETYQANVAKRFNSFVDDHMHGTLVDAEVRVLKEFYESCQRMQILT